MINIDVISGFLGAGKTTFINRLCKVIQNFGETAVIIENEYGDESVDSQLLADDNNKIIDLSQGCICCTLKTGLVDALSEIAEKIKPSRVLIEPSGVFILSEIFSVLKNPEISPHYELSSTITLVDAPLFLKFKGKYGIYMENQIKFSSQIILTKQENLSKEQISAIIDEIKIIKPDATICTKCVSELDDEQMMAFTQSYPVLQPDESVQTKHAALKSMTLYPKKCYDIKTLENILNAVKNGYFGDVYRLKGFVKSTNGDDWFNLQYVGGTYTITLTTKQFKPMLNIIGDQINKTELKGIFR